LDVLSLYRQASAFNAAAFLEELQRMPFPVRAIQVDGGSEFQAEFEDACRRRGVPLYVLPPRSPKLNGHVERANRTHDGEFYQLYEGELELPAMRSALLAHEDEYNHVRPHQSLGYLTPWRYLQQRTASVADLVSPSLGP
jgi:transposase InsO family protein